ncbi:MAG: hypothetical protein JF615_04865 [Asticcacaulis sp.]|nr:hypothetical protein [Asticcacaulis sp.]
MPQGLGRIHWRQRHMQSTDRRDISNPDRVLCASWSVIALSCLLALTAPCPLRAAPAKEQVSRLQVFPFPKPIQYTHHNDAFTVRVRIPGGEWRDLYEYKVKVDLDDLQDASMVYFNFTGRVDVAVQKNNGTAHSVVVRPIAKGIGARLKDDTAYFTLTRPEDVSIEFDGDHLHNLHLFTHAIRDDMPAHPAVSSDDIGAAPVPDLTKPVVYFGPGIYTPPDGEGGSFRIGSNTTVYVDGSALLKGTFVVDGAENVKIVSDGLYEGQKDLFLVRNSKNVVVDGPITINPAHGTARCTSSEHVEFRHMRIIGGGQWSDGIGNFACHDVMITDSFVRTSDDSITVYNHRWDIWGDSRDITVSNSTLWADVAHAVMIGMHGNTPGAAHPESEVIERLRFRNLDILDVDEDEPEYEGALAITAGDDNLVRDVVFEDIRVERIEEGKLFNLHVGFNAKYNTSPGRGIENITFRNIRFSGHGSTSASLIAGYDADRAVRNIMLQNVRIAGRPIVASASGTLTIGPFASAVSVDNTTDTARPAHKPK